MQTTASATTIEPVPGLGVPRARFGTRTRRVEQKPQVAAPPRSDDGDAWVFGLLGTLLLTNVGVALVVANYLA